MSTHTIDLATSIEQVRPAEWDALCVGRRFVNHRWQRLAEEVLHDFEPRYLLARREGELQAAAVCSIGRRFRHLALQQRLGWMLRMFPMMRCAIPFTSGAGLVVAPRPGAQALVPELLRALRRQALHERAPFLTYGQFSPGESTGSDLRAAGFYQHGRQVDMLLPIAWSSTAEYLASLPGSDRRKIGKLERRAEREGIRVTRLASPLAHAGALRGLIAGVLAHHGTCDIYAADLLERAYAICGDDMHVLAAWRDGELIGCVVALQDGDALLAKWIGLDYSRSWGTAAYRLLVLGVVRLAIEQGLRLVALGPSAAEAKRDLGAVADERLSALGVLAPLPASMVGAAAQLVAGRAAIDPTFSAAQGTAPASPG